MRTFDVTKAFNTANRRLDVGGKIREDEVIEPHSFEERERNGFLKKSLLETAAPVAAADTPAPVMGEPEVQAEPQPGKIKK